MTWIVAGASLFATWLNIRRVRICFAIWLCTNLTWAGYDFAHGLPAQGSLMLVYATLAVWGWHAWGSDEEKGAPGRAGFTARGREDRARTGRARTDHSQAATSQVRGQDAHRQALSSPGRLGPRAKPAPQRPLSNARRQLRSPRFGNPATSPRE